MAWLCGLNTLNNECCRYRTQPDNVAADNVDWAMRSASSDAVHSMLVVAIVAHPVASTSPSASADSVIGSEDEIALIVADLHQAQWLVQ
jgi:hypothetical protein